MSNDINDTRDHTLPGSENNLDTPAIKGHDFQGDTDLETLLDSFETTGFQATHLHEAIQIVKKMKEEDAKIFLAFTSNIISSGLREAVAHLAREDLVDVMITTSGSITEDVIKTMKPFKLGEWDADESKLREQGINRLGNIYVESKCYIKLEEFLNNEFFPNFFEDDKIRSPTEFARELGRMVDDNDSFLHHATKNNIPVHCPALTDAEIGNFLFYYRQEKDPDIGVEILDDWDNLIHEAIDAETTGIITFGAGVPKHHAIMSNQFRGGTDYAVYISTGMEGDGSLSGAPPEEAVSWGKIKEKGDNYAHIEAEATLVVPLLIAGAFNE